MNIFGSATPGGEPASTPQGRVLRQPYMQVEGPRHEDEDTIDLLELLGYLLRHRWLILGFLIAGLAGGVLVTLFQTPFYRATTKVEIVPGGAEVLQDLDVTGRSGEFRTIETEREKMLSRNLARRVSFELDLANDTQFLAPTPSFSLMNIIRRAISTSPQAKLYGLTAKQREEMAVRKIQNNLTVKLVPSTSILAVSYSHPDPAYAARVANQAVRSYIDQNADHTSATSDLARQFIEQQVRETKAKLQASERALIDYAKNAGITADGEEGSLIAQNISELNRALGEAIRQRLEAKRYYDQVQAGNAASLPEVFQSRSIQETKQKVAELKAQYQEKLGTLKPDFPEMRQLKARIQELEDQVGVEVSAIAQSVEIRYAQAQQRVQALKRELADLERQQAEFQNKNIQYTILKREVDSNSAQYDNLIEKLNDVSVGSQLNTTNAAIIDLAAVPRAPYSPRLPINMALALVLSGVLAVAAICFLELMNNTFAGPDELQKELKLPILGLLPLAGENALSQRSRESHSALSEAFGSLRTSLQFLGMEAANRTLLVTSASQGEGKSTSVYKLANGFAALDKNVLVIDADLRKPEQHRLFEIENTVGLSNMLTGMAQDLENGSLLQKASDERITVLASGPIPPNPVELLMSGNMARVLHQTAERYDIVLIDAPPVAGLADAPILSHYADATLLVVCANKVARNAVKMALSRLKAAGGNVLGAAFNMFKIDSFDQKYVYGYGQYDHYGYGRSGAGKGEHASPGPEQETLLRKLVRPFSALFARFRGRGA